MSNFKRIVALLLVALSVLAFAACGKEEEAPATTVAQGYYEDKETEDELPPDPDRGEDKIKIAVPSDFSGLTIASLAIDRSYAYTVEQKGVTAADAAEKIKNGTAQIAVLPLADAATLATQADVKILAVNTNLVLSVVAKEELVKNGYSDLNGQTVYACGEGTYIGWVTEEILSRQGIKANVVYTTIEDIEAKMKSGEAEICILPEFEGTRLANANEGFVKKFALTALWKEDFAPAATCIVAKADYVAANPEYIQEFITNARMETNSCIDNEAGVGYMAQILTTNGYFSDFELAKKAIASVGFVFLSGEEMKTAFEANIEFYADCGAEIVAPADSVYYGIE